MVAKKQPVEMTGLLTPRERVWQSVRRIGLKQRFTAMMVEDGCRPTVSYGVVSQYLRDLLAAGWLAQVDKVEPVKAGNRFAAPVYQLLKTDFEAPRVGFMGKRVDQGLGRMAMWRAMKVLKDFDFRDLARAASHPTSLVEERTAQLYLNALARAGYLTMLREPTRQQAGRYRLKRDTGHHAPAITRIKSVFDRNLGEFTWQQTGQEVCDGLE